MKKALAVVFSLCLFTALVSVPASAENVKLKMGTVWQTSGSYPGYVATRNVIVENNRDIQVAVVEQGGAVVTEEAVAQGRVDFGNGDAPDLYAKYKAIGKYAGKPKADMLRILWVNQHQPNTVFVVASSGVKSIPELNGKPYGVLIGSIVGDTFRAIMEVNGIKPDYFPGAPSALAEAVANKKIIGYCKAGVKEASIQQIAVSTPINILSVTDDLLNKLFAKYQGFHKAIIPAGNYPGQNQDVQSWTSASCMVGSNNLSEEVVYKMIKAVYKDRKKIISTVKGWNLMGDLPKNVLEFASIPLHPGTVKFLKEQGLTVPAKLMPPELRNK